MKCIVCKKQKNCQESNYFNIKFERFFAEEGSKFEDCYITICPDCMHNGLYFSPEKNLEISQREIDLAEANKKISELILERDNKSGEKDAIIKNLTEEVNLLNMNIEAGVNRWRDLYKSREELKERLKCEIELNKGLRKKEKHLREVLEENIGLREEERGRVFPKSLIEVRTSIFVPEGCIRVDGVDYRVEGEGKEGEGREGEEE